MSSDMFDFTFDDFIMSEPTLDDCHQELLDEITRAKQALETDIQNKATLIETNNATLQVIWEKARELDAQLKKAITSMTFTQLMHANTIACQDQTIAAKQTELEEAQHRLDMFYTMRQ